MWLRHLADTIRCGADIDPRVYVRMIRTLIMRVFSYGCVTSQFSTPYSQMPWNDTPLGGGSGQFLGRSSGKVSAKLFGRFSGKDSPLLAGGVSGRVFAPFSGRARPGLAGRDSGEVLPRFLGTASGRFSPKLIGEFSGNASARLFPLHSGHASATFRRRLDFALSGNTLEPQWERPRPTLFCASLNGSTKTARSSSPATSKEEQLRLEFLNPFLTALGWALDDTPLTRFVTEIGEVSLDSSIP